MASAPSTALAALPWCKLACRVLLGADLIYSWVQERLLGEDGHPRKVHEGEDPNRMGLVLEWVYGTIVSTAEKARDGAKRPLGTLIVDHSHNRLLLLMVWCSLWSQSLY